MLGYFENRTGVLANFASRGIASFVLGVIVDLLLELGLLLAILASWLSMIGRCWYLTVKMAQTDTKR